MGLDQHCEGPEAEAKRKAWAQRYTDAVVDLVKMVCDNHPDPHGTFKKALLKLNAPAVMAVCDICGDHVINERLATDNDGQRICDDCRAGVDGMRHQ